MYCSPETLNIAKFIKKDFLPSGLRCIHMHPAYKDRRQKEEWPKFLRYLKQWEKVRSYVYCYCHYVFWMLLTYKPAACWSVAHPQFFFPHFYILFLLSCCNWLLMLLKAALAETDNRQFYILPPRAGEDFSHAVVMHTVPKCQTYVKSGLFFYKLCISSSLFLSIYT